VSSFTRAIILLILYVVPCNVLQAGMPSLLPDDITTVFRLREEPELRLQVISFFLLGLVIAAFLVKCSWNGLRREFSRLPVLTYGKAMMITIAWGLLFCIVLVMISGARELMTPGAWKKSGAVYELQNGITDEVGSAKP
jgi:hypothetical protein